MLRDRSKDNNGNSHNSILIKGIENGTQRLRQIVDDMIDVSMIDNQLLDLNYQPIWLNRLLEMIQHEFRETISERHLGFILRPFPGLQEMTFGTKSASIKHYEMSSPMLLNIHRMAAQSLWTEGRYLDLLRSLSRTRDRYRP